MTQKSSDQLMESLSALVDGEASELEMHRVLKALDGNDDLQKAWSRYQLIGAALRQEATTSGMDLTASVRNAIDGSQSHSSYDSGQVGVHKRYSDTSDQNRRWLGWMAKSSVAASVAAVFVVGAGYIGSPALSVDQTSTSPTIASTSPSSTNSSASTTLSAPLGFELPAVESRTVSSSVNEEAAQAIKVIAPAQSMSAIEAKAFLNQLQLHHAQRASLNGSFSLMPFARVSELSGSQEQ